MAEAGRPSLHLEVPLRQLTSSRVICVEEWNNSGHRTERADQRYSSQIAVEWSTPCCYAKVVDVVRASYGEDRDVDAVADDSNSLKAGVMYSVTAVEFM